MYSWVANVCKPSIWSGPTKTRASTACCLSLCCCEDTPWPGDSPTRKHLSGNLLSFSDLVDYRPGRSMASVSTVAGRHRAGKVAKSCILMGKQRQTETERWHRENAPGSDIFKPQSPPRVGSTPTPVRSQLLIFIILSNSSTTWWLSIQTYEFMEPFLPKPPHLQNTERQCAFLQRKNKVVSLTMSASNTYYTQILR